MLAHIKPTHHDPIQLYLARLPLSPKLFFEDSATLCEEMGIATTDVYGDFPLTSEQSWLRRFESSVATRLGKEDAIFCTSGVLAQNIATKIHHSAKTADCGNSFICHHTSHLLLHEKEAFSSLLNLDAVVVQPSTGSLFQQPLMYDDVATLLDAEQKPFMLIIECPHREIGGKITPWEDLVQMSEHCRKRGIFFHCDGARLWEAESAYTAEGVRTFHEFCAIFDSIYVSFYKGLGGITGAMLLGSNNFIDEARIWSRRFGGNLYCQMPLAVSCWKGFKTNLPSDFAGRLAKLKTVVELIGKDSGTHFDGILEFDPPVPVVSMIHIYLRANVTIACQARDLTLAETGIACFARTRPFSSPSHGDRTLIELNMGPHNIQYDEDIWLLGWRTLMSKLVSLLSVASDSLEA